MKKGDKILILTIFILSIFSYGFIYLSGGEERGRYISLQVNGEEVKRLTFTSSEEPYVYRLETEHGLNVVEVVGNKVHLIEADCPDKLCIKQGFIEKTGEVIVCIPNKMVLEIKSDNLDKELDGINY